MVGPTQMFVGRLIFSYATRETTGGHHND